MMPVLMTYWRYIVLIIENWYCILDGIDIRTISIDTNWPIEGQADDRLLWLAVLLPLLLSTELLVIIRYPVFIDDCSHYLLRTIGIRPTI